MRQPPKSALTLLDLFVPASERESMAGDLVEEFQDVAGRRTPREANRWFRAQVLRSIGALAWTGACASPWRTLGAALAGILVLCAGLAFYSALVVTAVWFRLSLFSLSQSYDWFDYALLALTTLVPLMLCVLAAYVAARLARGSGLHGVFALGLFVTIGFAAGARALATSEFPLWLIGLILCFSWPALLAGAFFRARRQTIPTRPDFGRPGRFLR